MSACARQTTALPHLYLLLKYISIFLSFRLFLHLILPGFTAHSSSFALRCPSSFASPGSVLFAFADCVFVIVFFSFSLISHRFTFSFPYSPSPSSSPSSSSPSPSSSSSSYHHHIIIIIHPNHQHVERAGRQRRGTKPRRCAAAGAAGAARAPWRRSAHGRLPARELRQHQAGSGSCCKLLFNPEVVIA